MPGLLSTVRNFIGVPEPQNEESNTLGKQYVARVLSFIYVTCRKIYDEPVLFSTVTHIGLV